MEVIWTASAAEDYLRANTARPERFASAADGALNLLRAFPEMGSKVSHSSHLRRPLVGRSRQFGIYYGLTAERITVVALVDLRQDSEAIEAIIRSRQP